MVLLRWCGDDGRFPVITMIRPEIIRFVRNFVENGENITEKWQGRYSDDGAPPQGSPPAARTARPYVCKLNVIKIIISKQSWSCLTSCAERSISPTSHSVRGCLLKKERKNRTCLTGGNANGSRPIRFYYSYCLNCNYEADSALMREITISGQKHFSSDYR